jgi:hypothetical protein
MWIWPLLACDHLLADTVRSALAGASDTLSLVHIESFFDPHDTPCSHAYLEDRIRGVSLETLWGVQAAVLALPDPLRLSAARKVYKYVRLHSSPGGEDQFRPVLAWLLALGTYHYNYEKYFGFILIYFPVVCR